MNINKEVNKMNKKARQAIEEEALFCICKTEEEVMTYYFNKLDNIQEAIDTLYSSLEREDFVKHDLASFIAVENMLLDKIIEVLNDYNENSNSYVFSVGRKMSHESNIFEDFMVEYCTTLLSRGVDIERIRLEDKKIKHTLAKRYVELLNSLADNMNRLFYGYVLYLQESLKYFREHYTICVNAPKEDIEVEIEREVYAKITDRHELEELALANGFRLKRITGSHHVYENGEGKVTVIPMHSYDIGLGLSHAIQKQILRGDNWC